MKNFTNFKFEDDEMMLLDTSAIEQANDEVSYDDEINDFYRRIGVLKD